MKVGEVSWLKMWENTFISSKYLVPDHHFYLKLEFIDIKPMPYFLDKAENSGKKLMSNDNKLISLPNISSIEKC